MLGGILPENVCRGRLGTVLDLLTIFDSQLGEKDALGDYGKAMRKDLLWRSGWISKITVDSKVYLKKDPSRLVGHLPKGCRQQP